MRPTGLDTQVSGDLPLGQTGEIGEIGITPDAALLDVSTAASGRYMTGVMHWLAEQVDRSSLSTEPAALAAPQKRSAAANIADVSGLPMFTGVSETVVTDEFFDEFLRLAMTAVVQPQVRRSIVSRLAEQDDEVVQSLPLESLAWRAWALASDSDYVQHAHRAIEQCWLRSGQAMSWRVALPLARAESALQHHAKHSHSTSQTKAQAQTKNDTIEAPTTTDPVRRWYITRETGENGEEQLSYRIAHYLGGVTVADVLVSDDVPADAESTVQQVTPVQASIDDLTPAQLDPISQWAWTCVLRDEGGVAWQRWSQALQSLYQQQLQSHEQFTWMSSEPLMLDGDHAAHDHFATLAYVLTLGRY